ncbi:MAG: gamma-glutamyltranspeptidase/glutathione hydrolase [Candidatus Azotimanducaceae bacterium]|jgi:gamma-glutamyltranspeptidase/glutathione hydrolase
MVATSQPLATYAGLRMLEQGGNAVDAALAAAIALTVVEPNNNGIGSDAFAILWDGNSLHGLNASGRSPQDWNPERFQAHQSMPHLGWDSVTVPGAVSAWVELSQKFGRLPFAKLFESAVHYAENGYQVGPKSGYYWGFAPQQFKPFDSFMSTFCPNGKAPEIGSVVQLKDHARSLQLIAETNGESFYRGELADRMIQHSAECGGAMTHEDLDLHQCDWVGTLSQQLAGTDVSLHEIPPNGQGLLALVALGIVNHLDIANFALDSANSVHLQIEATRIAYAEVERHLADITYMKITPEMLLDAEYLERRAAEIDLTTANENPTTLGASEDTVYLSAADESGMMVSFIQSNYRGFGSGIVVPGTGISLQNRGSGFTTEKGHPNEVAGGKRPYQTIIPGFATHIGQPVMSFGVMGGHMQAQGHLQMMIRVFLHNQNPQAASDAPRWHLREDGVVCLEQGFDPSVIQELANRGHRIELNQPEHIYGGAQLIYKMASGYVGGSDHRKEGYVGAC